MHLCGERSIRCPSDVHQNSSENDGHGAKVRFVTVRVYILFFVNFFLQRLAKAKGSWLKTSSEVDAAGGD